MIIVRKGIARYAYPLIFLSILVESGNVEYENGLLLLKVSCNIHDRSKRMIFIQETQCIY